MKHLKLLSQTPALAVADPPFEPEEIETLSKSSVLGTILTLVLAKPFAATFGGDEEE